MSVTQTPFAASQEKRNSKYFGRIAENDQPFHANSAMLTRRKTAERPRRRRLTLPPRGFSAEQRREGQHMTQHDRWLACDGYTIELKDGHSLPLHDLHTMAGRRQRFPLRMMVWGLVNWLVKPSSAASFRCMDFAGGGAADPDAHTAAPAATAAYRTDAALGHFAGEEVASTVPLAPAARAARPGGSTQIAA